MKKGFTLIELLAVIVILAIIALIATPIVLNIINSTKDESNERSMVLYAEAVKEAVVRYQMNNNESVIGKFTTTDGTKLTLSGETEPKLIVDYDGDVVCSTIELYSYGNLYLDGCEVNKSSKEYTYGIKQRYNDGQVVYFDVMTGKGCSEEEYKKSWDGIDYLNSSVGYNGVIVDLNGDGKDDEGRNSCLKFYAFLDDGGESINLLLDHNTTKTIKYNRNSEQYAPSADMLKTLKDNTLFWTGVIEPENYVYNGKLKDGSEIKYEINYSGYKARLIEANEIAQITKKIGWDEENPEASEYYYFYDLSRDYKTGSGKLCASLINGCEYGWLYDRTSENCKEYGCLYNADSSWSDYLGGYWTSSYTASRKNCAWHVTNDGVLSNIGIDNNYYGIRPVIEVYKLSLL